MTSENPQKALDLADLVTSHDEQLPDLAELLDQDATREAGLSPEGILQDGNTNQPAASLPASAGGEIDPVTGGQPANLTLLYDDMLGDDGTGSSIV